MRNGLVGVSFWRIFAVGEAEMGSLGLSIIAQGILECALCLHV